MGTSTRLCDTFILIFLILVCSNLESHSIDVTLKVDRPIATVDNEFLSFTMDQYLLGIKPKWGQFDFGSPRVRTLLRGLSPAYLRFGGSPADWSIFTDTPVEKFQNLSIAVQRDIVTFTTKDLDNLVNITRDTGNRFLHEFNLQLRFGKGWDPTNAIEMFNYIASKGYGENLDFELGNEPGAYHVTKGFLELDSKTIGQDYITLRKLMRKYNLPSASKLVGPDEVGLTSGIFPIFIDTVGSNVDAVTFHHYYFYGPSASVGDYIDHKHFSNLEENLHTLQKQVSNTSNPSMPIWIGETSDSWGSGTPNISDRYVNGFLWMDKLGVCSKMNVKVVIRQDFYGHDYGLIGDDLLPNPDYWLSYIYKQLVSTSVLNIELTPSWDEHNDIILSTRAYAHCTMQGSLYNKQGIVTFYALNVNKTTESLLFLPTEFLFQEVHVFLLSAPDNILTSRTVLLNGSPLMMPDAYHLPQLKPKIMKSDSFLTVPPLTMSFFVFPEVTVPACL